MVLPSRREQQILALASQGYCDKEIGIKLGISHNTVKNIKVSLFGKMGASNIVHAVALAISQGLIPKVNTNKS